MTGGCFKRRDTRKAISYTEKRSGTRKALASEESIGKGYSTTAARSEIYDTRRKFEFGYCLAGQEL